jgi:hypothetical protein
MKSFLPLIDGGLFGEDIHIAGRAANFVRVFG